MRKVLAAFGVTSLGGAIAEPVGRSTTVELSSDRSLVTVDAPGIRISFCVPRFEDGLPARLPADSRFEVLVIQLTKAYPGELPAKIAFTDKLPAVCRKLKRKAAWRTRGWDVWPNFERSCWLSIRFSRTGAMQTMQLTHD